MEQLENATTETDLLNVFVNIEGPFAFVYYRASTRKIWFSRDCLGRRSLLWYKSKNGPFMLSSVGKANDIESDNGIWEEVPANGIYCIDVDAVAIDDDTPSACGRPIKLYPWTYNDPSEKIEKLHEGQLVC